MDRIPILKMGEYLLVTVQATVYGSVIAFNVDRIDVQ